MSDRPVGLIKSVPEHFIVLELWRHPERGSVHSVPLHPTTKITGRGRRLVTVFEMVKRGLETRTAVQEVARQLGVAESDISYYGIKDKHAATAQRIGVAGDFTPTFAHDKIVLYQVGEDDRALRPGGNYGNRFQITVLTDAMAVNEARIMKSFPNLFGHQRFRGIPGVGRLILEKRFQEAVELLQKDRLGDTLAAIREGRPWDQVLFDRRVKFEIDFRIRQWQSELWNALVTKKGAADLPARLPVWSRQSAHWYRDLWNPNIEALDPRALERIEKFERAVRVKAENARCTKIKGGWKFTFDLTSGSYATVFLGQLFDVHEAQ